MVNAETTICQIRELFDKVKAASFGGMEASALTVRFPDYLPPLILRSDASELICRATSAIRKCALPGDSLFVSARYEDRRDPADCCVVLSLDLRRPGEELAFCVESGWLEEFDRVADELLCRSVASSMWTADGCFSFDFRLAVHFGGAKTNYHRNAILLVEDDDFVRGATREVLEVAGYNVIEAENAEAALSAFERNQGVISAVLSDVTMPGRSGQELARAVHALLPSLPVLLMTGYQTPVVEDRLRRVFYLAKPYNSAALLEAVRRCLEVHHQPPATIGILGTAAEKRITAFE